MEDTSKFRIVRTRVARGRVVWVDEPVGLHEHELPGAATAAAEPDESSPAGLAANGARVRVVEGGWLRLACACGAEMLRRADRDNSMTAGQVIVAFRGL